MKIKLLALTFLFVLLAACSVLPVVGDSLEGTSWELYAISKHRPIEGSSITITFEDGQVSGSSGCNRYGGEYKASGKKIEFGVIEATLMACVDPAMMEQESSFMQMLGDAHRFELVDDRLLIYWSEHEALTFIPAD